VALCCRAVWCGVGLGLGLVDCWVGVDGEAGMWGGR